MGRLQFLGTAAAVPAPGRESASYLIDDGILIDLGWNVTERLRALGHDPCAIHTLILTHGHHDHYLGLPQFLFYRQMRPGNAKAPLRVIGPAEDLARILESAWAFLQYGEHGHRFAQPEAIALEALQPGDTFAVGGYAVRTARGIHPVPALCYRFESNESALVVCSDTAYHPPLADFARGARVLIHEASFGPKEAPESNPYGHSGAAQAARIAQMAQVESLYLVHLADADRPAALAAARAHFANTQLGVDGETVAWTRGPSTS